MIFPFSFLKPQGASLPIVSDPNAQAFINAAVITNVTQANAINNLVIGLKADNLWNSLNDIYPLVGGTASTHKWNLKNTAGNQLNFLGGITHNANGITGNGINGYVNTNNFAALSVGIYSRTSNPFANTAFFGKRRYNENEEGNSYNEGYSILYDYFFRGGVNGATDTLIGAPPYNKFINVVGSNSSDANQLKVYRNGINVLATSAAFSTPWPTDIDFALLGTKYKAFFDSGNTFVSEESISNANIAFATFSNSILNATQNLNLSNRIQEFQTALSRQV